MRIRSIVVTGTAITALISLSACSGSDDNSSSATKPSPRASAATTTANLTQGVVYDKELRTYRFLLELNTSTVRVFLNDKGNLVGLHFLETDKNFHYTIKRAGDAPIDCILPIEYGWVDLNTAQGTSNVKIGGRYDNDFVSFKQPINWTSLVSSDAGGLDKPFKRSSLRLSH